VVKNALGYDDSLDVFGVHCIGGIVGALGTGILVNPALGGAGIMDYTTGKIADYDFAAQMISQTWGVCTTLVWSGVGSAILYKVVDVIVGLRANVESEREGLDITEHTEPRLQYVSSPGARSRQIAPKTTVWAHTRQCPDC